MEALQKPDPLEPNQSVTFAIDFEIVAFSVRTLPSLPPFHRLSCCLLIFFVPVSSSLMAFYRGKDPSPLDDDPNSSAFQFSINPDGSDPRHPRKSGPERPDLLSAAGKGEGLIEVGRHCSEPSCHQLDFLPHLCHKCGQYYCLDHFQLTRHKCVEPLESVNTMPTCPLCNKDIKVPRNASKDEYVDRHIASGCTEHLLALTAQEKEARRQAWHCDAGFCSNTKDKLSTLTCPQCHGTFCLKHRFPSDHRCEDQQRERAEKARIARLGAVERRRAAAGAAAGAAVGSGSGSASADGAGSNGFFAGVKSASMSLLEKLRLKREARTNAAAAAAAAAAATTTPAASSGSAPGAGAASEGVGKKAAHGPAPPSVSATSAATSTPASASSSSSSSSIGSSSSSSGSGVPNSSRPILVSPHLSAGTPPAVSPMLSPANSAAAAAGANGNGSDASSRSNGSNGQGGVWSLGPLPPAAAAATPTTAPLSSPSAAAAAPTGPAAYLPAPFGRFGARATGSALRQLQSQAKGDTTIPAEHRLCLRIRFPPTAPPGARIPPALARAGGVAVVWVDKRWSVGRALDAVCRLVGIPLTNHLAGKPQAQLAPAAAPGSGFGHGEKLAELEAAKEGADVAFGWVIVPGRA